MPTPSDMPIHSNFPQPAHSSRHPSPNTLQSWPSPHSLIDGKQSNEQKHHSTIPTAQTPRHSLQSVVPNPSQKASSYLNQPNEGMQHVKLSREGLMCNLPPVCGLGAALSCGGLITGVHPAIAIAGGFSYAAGASLTITSGQAFGAANEIRPRDATIVDQPTTSWHFPPDAIQEIPSLTQEDKAANNLTCIGVTTAGIGAVATGLPTAGFVWRVACLLGMPFPSGLVLSSGMGALGGLFNILIGGALGYRDPLPVFKVGAKDKPPIDI